MTAQNFDSQRLGAEMEAEHRQVRALIDRLKSPQDAEQLRRSLDELHAALMSHFAHEQYPGGFYELLGACVPAFRDDLRVLVDQHFQILTAVHGLRDVARRTTEDGPVLQSEVDALVEQLQRHEAREHEMMDKLLKA